MPEKQDIGKLLRQSLGREAAEAMLARINEMVAKGAKAAAIEKAIIADLQAHIEQQVVSTVIAKIGPITPVKVQPIQAQVKPAIKPITVSPKINTGVSVKVGPGIMAKGAKK
jgi:hypothetical protein